MVKLCLAFTWALFAAKSIAYNVPKGSPGFYHGNSTAAVTFDDHSLFLDGKRLYVFSGEVHPWRLPTGVPGWRDVLQKMKAAGFNTVSIYLNWGLSEGTRGSLDFDYYRSHTDFYQVAKEVGMLVISRIGPYINAETHAGGFPGWLTNEPARARSNETGFIDAWTPWIEASAKFIKPYQYPDGPIIAVQPENEFWESPVNSAAMQLVEDSLRANGITRVPLLHNDNDHNGTFVNGTGAVDIYTWDSYPQGFFCAQPDQWVEIDDSWQEMEHKKFLPDMLWGSGEFQAGAFDPWGGNGYDNCYRLTNEQFANVQYKNNYAFQTTWMNLYMTYGGTNWGNLAEPDVYTSYDYAAPIREDRTLSPKYNELKLQANFLHASPDFLTASRIGYGTTYSNNPRVYTTALRSTSGVNFYIVRQISVKHLDAADFKLQVDTAEGPLLVPRFGDAKATLDGRESQILVSEYPYGSHLIKYSTAEIFTWTSMNGIDHIVLYAQRGHSIEAIITGSISNGSPTISKASKSSDIRAFRDSDGALVISGKPHGQTVVHFGSTKIFVVDKETALSFWNVRLSHSNGLLYDQSPEVPSVLVFGPYLVRNATLENSSTTLSLFGDFNTTTPLEIVAPHNVKAVKWNGKHISVRKTDWGTLQGDLVYKIEQPPLPNLRDTVWTCADSLPEIRDDFDDARWLVANKTQTARPLQYQPYGGKQILYADEYGFHQGNTIFRGHFDGRTATGVQLSVEGGFNFGYSTWVNSKFLGSNTGTNSYHGGIDKRNDTWHFDPQDLKGGDNVLTVIVDPTGLYEDYGADDLFKSPRGIRGYQLLSPENKTDFDFWKIQGNFLGEGAPDKVRGPLNEGGLFVEREGAHLPGFPGGPTWQKSTLISSCTPFDGLATAGIMAYRTSFELDLPEDADMPLALRIEREPELNYRSVIYVNGWQFGRFNSQDGPQTVFPMPEGILNHRGKNELLITVWSMDAQGAKIANIEIVPTALIVSSKEVIPGTVESPGYAHLRAVDHEVLYGDQKAFGIERKD